MTRLRSPGAPLLVALLVAILYAAFAGGAAGLPEETRLQVWLAIVAALTASAALLSSRVHTSAPALAWAGVGLLVLFAAWSGLSIGWSVAPDRSWIELNRAIAYAVVAALAIALGATRPNALSEVAVGYLGVACLVALYAAGGKVAPGFEISGLIDLNHAEQLSRLREPLEYWNALALFLVLAMPIALAIASDRTRRIRHRTLGLLALELLIVCAGLTYSRGGLIAALVTFATLVAFVPRGQRLATLAFLGLAVLVSLPILGVAFSAQDLIDRNVPVSARDEDGALMGALLIGGLLALAAMGRSLMAVEDRIRLGPPSPVARRTGRALAALAVVILAVSLVPGDGLRGKVAEEARAFTEIKEDNTTDPARLLSTNSGNRWVWWEEAVGAWSDKPLAGWGAGSFPVTHRLYRDNRLSVQQPHSVPLQWLAETGLIGGLLALGGLSALGIAALLRVRRMEPGQGRLLGAAMLAGTVGWALHGWVDWDYDIPGVVLPALVFLGVLAATPPGTTPTRSGGRAPEPLRVAAAAIAVLAAAVVSWSAMLPAVSDARTREALASLTKKSTPAQFDAAVAKAKDAAQLNPYSVAPLFAQAAIAQRRGKPLDARQLYLDAAARQPYSIKAWFDLIRIEGQRLDVEGSMRAARRALDVDPQNPVAAGLLGRVVSLAAPPFASATATGTPLPRFVPVKPKLPKLPPPAATPPATTP